MDKRVIDYIKSNLSEGHSQEEIKKALIKAGIQKENIEEAISLLKREPPIRNKGKTITFAVLGIVLTACIILFLWLFLHPPGEISSKIEDYQKYCEKSSVKESCLKSVAIYNNDEKICLEISESSEKDECISVIRDGEILFKEKDSNLDFSNISSLILECRERCINEGKIFRERVLPYTSISYYYSLKENFSIFSCSCYDSQIKYDSSMCEDYNNKTSRGISGTKVKNACYIAVARENKDSSICENIEENSSRNACKSSLQNINLA